MPKFYYSLKHSIIEEAKRLAVAQRSGILCQLPLALPLTVYRSRLVP